MSELEPAPPRTLVLQALGPALVAVLLFWPILTASYLKTWDDSLILLDRRELDSFSIESIRAVFRPGGFEEYLPVRDLTYLIEHLLPIRRVVASHLMNLVLFALGTAAVHVLALRFGASPTAAGWAALLFAVHPVHVEAVAPAASRKEVLSLVLTLASFLVWLSGRDRGSLPRKVVALLLFPAAMLSKTTVVSLPLMIGFAVFALGTPLGAGSGTGSREGLWPRRLWESLVEAAPFLLLALAILPITLEVRAIWRVEQPYEGLTYVGDLMLVPQILCTYLRVLLWPGPLEIGHALPFPTWRNPRIWGDLFVVAVMVALAVWSSRRDRPLALGWAWLAIFLLPVVNLIPQPIFAADRYLTIPSVGAAIVAGRLIERFTVWMRDRGRAQLMVALALPVAAAVLLGCRTAARVPEWSTDVRFWKAQAEASPVSWQALRGLGLALRAEGRTEEALAAFRGAASNFGEKDARFRGSETRYANLQIEVGDLEYQRGNPAAAAKAYRIARDSLPSTRGPDQALLTLRLAEWLDRAGLKDEALAEYRALAARSDVPSALRDFAAEKIRATESEGMP